MACKDCFRNCDNIISDKCVEYTGEPIPLLGICKGDTLYEVEVAIIEKLLTTLDGTGISVESLDLTCPFIEDILNGEDKTLINILQVLIKANCTLKELIVSIENQIDDTFIINTLCLSGVNQDSTKNEIIQAIITKLCNIETQVNTIINSNYVTGDQLCDLVTQCIQGNQPGNEPIQYNARMVPGILYPYVGSLSNFDNTGKGLAANGFDKVYIYNGLNGTADIRGRALVGAVQNVPGGPLDAEVDPSLPQNAGNNYTINQKFGVSSVTLTVNEMPGHTHVVNDPGHSHTYTETTSSSHPSGGSTNSPRQNVNSQTSTSLTNITINSTGGSQPHTNVQPSMAAYFIIYIP